MEARRSEASVKEMVIMEVTRMVTACQHVYPVPPLPPLAGFYLWASLLLESLQAMLATWEGMGRMEGRV